MNFNNGQKPPDMSDEQWQDILNQHFQQSQQQYIEQDPPRFVVCEINGAVDMAYYDRQKQEQIRMNNVLGFSEMRLLQLERTFYQEQRDKCIELCQNVKELLYKLLYCDKDKETYRFLDQDLINDVKQMINQLDNIDKVEADIDELDRTKQIVE